jgi:hypothetical protein
VLDMALTAARGAMEQARCAPEDLSLILSMGISPDRIADRGDVAGPRVCHPLQRDLGARNAFVFDLQDADWPLALDVAAGFCGEMGWQRALVVRAEASTESLLPDPETGFTVPDGAGALVVSAGEQKRPASFKSLDAFRPAAVYALTSAEQSRSPGRGRFSFPAQPGLLDGLHEAARELLTPHAPHAGHIVAESWFPGHVDASSLAQTLGKRPMSYEHVGPYSLPLAAAELLQGGRGGRHLLGLTFDPFQLRVGCRLMEI